MAPFKGHLDQAGHHGRGPQQRLQHQQHRQAGHHVLAEGEGERHQHLGRERSPQARRRRQGFTQQQTGEHQGEQDQGQLVPEGDHRWRDQGQGAAGGEQQPQGAGQQRFRNPPAVHTQQLAQQTADRQQGQQQPQGQAEERQCRRDRGHHPGSPFRWEPRGLDPSRPNRSSGKSSSWTGSSWSGSIWACSI